MGTRVADATTQPTRTERLAPRDPVRIPGRGSLVAGHRGVERLLPFEGAIARPLVPSSPLPPVSLRCIARLAVVLLPAVAAPGAVEAQERESAAVTLAATAAPRLVLVALTRDTAIQAGDATHAHRMTTDANVARAVVVRHAGADSSRTVEVRDRRGAWVPLDAEDGIVVFESGELGELTHLVECRVAAPPAAEPDCPLAYELTSRDPLFPMRVTARPAAPVAGR